MIRERIEDRLLADKNLQIETLRVQAVEYGLLIAALLRKGVIAHYTKADGWTFSSDPGSELARLADDLDEP